MLGGSGGPLTSIALCWGELLLAAIAVEWLRRPGGLAGVLLGEVEAPAWRRLSCRSLRLRSAICLTARGLPTGGRRSDKDRSTEPPAHGPGQDEQRNLHQLASTASRPFGTHWSSNVSDWRDAPGGDCERGRRLRARWHYVNGALREFCQEHAPGHKQPLLSFSTRPL